MLTFTLYFGSVIVAATCLVPIFIQYGRPGSIGSSAIQTIVASNWSATAGGELVQASTSPRLTSISSSSVSVTDCPATARSRSPSNVTMRATRLSRPDGSTAQLLARAHHAARDRAGEAAEIEVGAVDPLHRQPERLVLQSVLDLDRLEIVHQRRAVIPGHVLAGRDDVVALQARERDRHDVVQADLLGEVAVLGHDRSKISRE